MNDTIIRDSVKWHPLYKPVSFNLGSAEPKGSTKIFFGSAKYVDRLGYR
jgi:hypothetical protein